MADEKFKLPQSSYEEITKIIKAYGHLSKEVGLEEVSRLTSLHTTIISRNVGFLLAAGVLTPGSKKAVTETGKLLSRALEHEMPDEIRKSWRTIVQETDFLAKIIAAIKIRNGMDQQTLESHIAYSAGQPKSGQYMTGARTVIEIVRAAELIREMDGKYIADSQPFVEAERPGPSTSRFSEEIPEPMPAVVGRRIPLITTSDTNSVTININIACTPNDIAGLGATLRQLIDDLKTNKNTGSDE